MLVQIMHLIIKNMSAKLLRRDKKNYWKIIPVRVIFWETWIYFLIFYLYFFIKIYFILFLFHAAVKIPNYCRITPCLKHHIGNMCTL